MCTSPLCISWRPPRPPLFWKESVGISTSTVVCGSTFSAGQCPSEGIPEKGTRQRTWDTTADGPVGGRASSCWDCEELNGPYRAPTISSGSVVRPPWHPPQPSSQEAVGALGRIEQMDSDGPEVLGVLDREITDRWAGAKPETSPTPN